MSDENNVISDSGRAKWLSLLVKILRLIINLMCNNKN